MQGKYFPEHLIFFFCEKGCGFRKILQKVIKWERLHLPLINI